MAAALAVWALGASAATITASNGVLAQAVTGGGDFTGSDTGHTGLPGLYSGTGFQVGEAFAGQTVTSVFLVGLGNFEVVNGTPTGPLALQAPVSPDGVTLWGGAELQGLTGGGNACSDPCTGEGAVSFLFDVDQSAIGLDIVKYEGYGLTLQFFEADGTAFAAVSLTTGGSKTFTAQAGHAIRGVTITNTDTFGVAFDNLRLSPAAPIATGLPEPPMLALVLLAGLAADAAGLRSPSAPARRWRSVAPPRSAAAA